MSWNSPLDRVRGGTRCHVVRVYILSPSEARPKPGDGKQSQSLLVSKLRHYASIDQWYPAPAGSKAHTGTNIWQQHPAAAPASKLPSTHSHTHLPAAPSSSISTQAPKRTRAHLPILTNSSRLKPTLLQIQSHHSWSRPFCTAEGLWVFQEMAR